MGYLHSKKIRKGLTMLTDEKVMKLIHEYNDGGIRSVFGLTTNERMMLIRYFAKTNPKCPCDQPHNA